MAIATAANDHRLGANEAPPAILSVFLGEQLEDVFSQIGENGSAPSSKQGGVFATGVDILPDIPKEAGDRNRTSPFAFTGNKFELRAVGGSHNIAGPNTVLNAHGRRADGLHRHEAREGRRRRRGPAQGDPVVAARDDQGSQAGHLQRRQLRDEWHQEAERRGLPNLRNTPDALDVLLTDKCKSLLSKYGIYTAVEIEARFNVLAEQYINTIAIEGGTAGHIAKTMILPAALRYAEEVGEAVEMLGAEATAELVEHAQGAGRQTSSS